MPIVGRIPLSGTLTSLGISSTMSGGRPDGWLHPSANVGTGGARPAPSGPPALAQSTMIWISCELSDASFRNRPNRGSASHGGISLAATFFSIARIHGRTSANELRGIGAALLVLWQPTHLAKTIGATFWLNVG